MNAGGNVLIRLYEYRYFILSSIESEFRNRFARSKLGGFWAIINPMSQVAIYALILSNVLAAKLPGIDNKYAYALYIMSGLLGWSMFSEVVTTGTSLFVAKGNLIKKMNFPKITLPAIMLGTALINNAMLLASMLFVFAILGHGVTLALFWLLPLTILLAGFAVALGIVLGALNVFVRDVGHMVTVLFQLWFWFTPIVYPVSIIPEKYQPLLYLNPVYVFIDAYHQIIVYGATPDFLSLLACTVITVLALSLGVMFFRRASDELVDEL